MIKTEIREKMRTRELHLNAQELLEQRLAESLGLDRYAGIMKSFQSTDVSTDEAFQKNFNAFYMVRKNAGWRSIYYQLFEKAKHESMAYEDILEALYEKTGMVEASFASKMIATLDDQCPIIDQYVLKNLGLIIAGSGKEADCAVQFKPIMSSATGMTRIWRLRRQGRI